MRETKFIEQNKEKWQEFEHILEGQFRDPDKLNELFIQVTDDLSYSRTFYPNRSVRVYLNGLAQRVFFSIYRTRQSPFGRLLSFWTDELPALVYDARHAFRLSFGIFAVAFAIGMVSSAMDPEFSSIILGESYVQMTIENIESGDPMAVYKQRGKFGMSLGITANNLFVAFLTFVMGVFFAVGTVAIMIRNGIMVGVFQHFFIERGLFWDSFLTIWTHGTLEISAIIIAGAAGIVMGRGLLFPGTYTRMQAFQVSARRGLKIMIGITPIIILAGFIEGYLTRHTGTPDIVRALFILACLGFVLLYFGWYPRIHAQLAPRTMGTRRVVPPDSSQEIDFERIKSSGEIFADVFVFFKKQAGKIAGLSLLTAGLYTALAFAFSRVPAQALFSFPNRLFGTLSVIDQFFVNPGLPGLPLINFAVFALLTVTVNRLLLQTAAPGRQFPFRKLLIAGLRILAGLALLQLLLWTNAWYTIFLLLFAAPVALLFNYIIMAEGLHLWPGLRRTAFLLAGTYGRLLSLFLTLALVGLLFFSLLDTMIMWTFLDLISWIVQFEEQVMNELSVVVLTFATTFFIHLIAGMLLTGIGLAYYSLREIQQADALRARVKGIGLQGRIQGWERERKAAPGIGARD